MNVHGREKRREGRSDNRKREGTDEPGILVVCVAGFILVSLVF